MGTVWLARKKEDITFALREPLEQRGVNSVHAEVTRIDLDNRHVYTSKDESVPYDYLVIATGPKLNYAAIAGLGPRGYTQSILTLKIPKIAKICPR